MNRTLKLQTNGTLCNVCGGAQFKGACALRCERMVYEARRARQYKRRVRYYFLVDTPAQIEYNLRRLAQYERNLAERAQKAALVKAHEGRRVA
jgi:hypothetical protein